MLLQFKNLPPMPRNSATFVVNNRQVKTALARAFEVDVNKRLQQYNHERDKFVTIHKLKSPKQGLQFTLSIYAPESKFYTKDGRIHQHSVDWDAHKLLVDCIHRWLGIDDSQTVDAHVKRRVSSNDEWHFFIEIL